LKVSAFFAIHGVGKTEKVMCTRLIDCCSHRTTTLSKKQCCYCHKKCIMLLLNSSPKQGGTYKSGLVDFWQIWLINHLI